MFAACTTQWAHAPGLVAVPTGLPAERVEAKASGLGVTADADFWWRFEVLENEALRLLHDEVKRASHA